MIKLYTWKTANGHKIAIMLEETGMPYELVRVNIGAGEQHEPTFIKLSPNNRIPAIVDDEAEGGPLSIFESGAILTYLADKSGRFLARSGAQRYKALAWLFWQVGHLGPMMGQVGFFGFMAKEKSQFAIDRFVTESGRLLGVMERQLSQTAYLGGDDYTIADMAAYPWATTVEGPFNGLLGPHLEDKPGVKRWLKAVGDRPAVQRGMTLQDAL